jgi:hypothetical protein
MDERFAWRLFFKALPEVERRAGLDRSGDARLTEPIAGALAVMA